MNQLYDDTSAESIFAHSSGLLQHTLAEAVLSLNPTFNVSEIKWKGKGGLGQLVEKYWYGYEPNSDPRPDFAIAGVELKTTPLKTTKKEEYTIKERLVCDMIDYFSIVNVSFTDSPFYKKCLLMLILFYLHMDGVEARDLTFIYSVLWKLQDKDLEIIRHDYEVIIGKIRNGKAHELSEGDTMYLGACRKGHKGQPDSKQPFSKELAPRRAFSLKPAYMRTILDFVRSSGRNMATNTNVRIPSFELVSIDELKHNTFEDILTGRLMLYHGMDYKQIASALGIEVSLKEKSKLARVTKQILLKGLNNFEDAEEIKKAGIIAKTIRIELNGRIKESMSFENINYQEIHETDDWEESRWYEIATSKFMFVIYKAVEDKSWTEEQRYVLDKVMFWTMPPADLHLAHDFWDNIRTNVENDTLQNDNNTFWRMGDKKNFHVRPKAQTAAQKFFSPISGVEVPKKCYWFNSEYVEQIIKD